MRSARRSGSTISMPKGFEFFPLLSGISKDGTSVLFVLFLFFFAAVALQG